MFTTLETSVTDVLDRLGDVKEEIWSRDEIALYLQDGYNELCRRTRCLFDIYAIDPNVTWELPELTVDLHRVSFNQLELVGVPTMQMRQLDPLYESRQGSPQFFTFDGHGPFTIATVPEPETLPDFTSINPVIPPFMPENTGGYGVMTYTDDPTVTLDSLNVGLIYGAPTFDNVFPTHGPWGVVTQWFPDAEVVFADVARLGRPLAEHPSELPRVYDKYVTYWAMAQALKHDGPGQDVTLAEHYSQRFEMGVDRMMHRVDRLSSERQRRLRPPNSDSVFGIGDPLLPTNYPRAF